MIKSNLVKFATTLGNFAKNEIMSALEAHKVRELLRKTESSKRTERVIAYAKLKKFHPDIYSELKGCGK